MFKLTFSHIVDGQRAPLIINGQEHTMSIEATNKTDAIYKPEVKTFCDTQGNDTRVRGVR